MSRPRRLLTCPRCGQRMAPAFHPAPWSPAAPATTRSPPRPDRSRTSLRGGSGTWYDEAALQRLGTYTAWTHPRRAMRQLEALVTRTVPAIARRVWATGPAAKSGACLGRPRRCAPRRARSSLTAPRSDAGRRGHLLTVRPLRAAWLLRQLRSGPGTPMAAVARRGDAPRCARVNRSPAL